jgi:hypothetical protein
MPKKPAGNNFLANMPLPTVLGQSAMQGRLCDVDHQRLQTREPQPFYRPAMVQDAGLANEIGQFSRFLTRDLWAL